VNLSLVAAALDPRYGHLDFISRELRDSVWIQVQNWAEEFNELSGDTPASQPRDDDEPPQPNVASVAFSTVLKQLREYFERKIYQRTNDWKYLDPLEKWKSFQGWYDCIKPFVRLIFSIPCTSAPSERVFSHAGYLCSKTRNRIDPDLLELCTVVQSYLRNFVDDEDEFFANLHAQLNEMLQG
jgi:hypothetical protein